MYGACGVHIGIVDARLVILICAASMVAQVVFSGEKYTKRERCPKSLGEVAGCSRRSCTPRSAPVLGVRSTRPTRTNDEVERIFVER